MNDYNPDRDWVTHHDKSWRTVLRHLIGRDGVHALEIGSMEGRSAVWWCMHVLTGEGSQLTCVDTWRSVWAAELEEERFDRNTAPWPVEKIRGKSRDVLPHLLAEGRRYDFVYVDGDHRARTCLLDCVLGWELLKDKGILIVDDYLWTHPDVAVPPKVAIDAFLRSNADRIRWWNSPDDQVVCWK